MGAVETIVVSESLSADLFVLRNKSTGELTELLVRPDQKKSKAKLMEKFPKSKFELVEKQLFLDYLTLKYKEFGADLEIISEKSVENSRMMEKFGGIGGFLRYSVDFDWFEAIDDDRNKFG